MNRSSVIAALLAAACLACGDSTGVDDEATFIAEPIASGEGLQEAAVIGSFIGSVQVDGIFAMPSPCYRLSGALSRLGGQLTVTVTATSTNEGACPGVVQYMDYRLQRFGMPRGLYRVTVYHQIAGQPRRLINEGAVTVN